MAKPEFTSVLDQMPDEIERPKPLPPGSYVTIIKDRYIQDKSSQKETPYIEFILHIVEALDNVDPDMLDEVLTRVDGEKRKLTDLTTRVRFYDTKDSGYRLKKFLLDDCQLENEGTIGQILDNTIGCQVIATVKHRSFGDDIIAEVKGTAPVFPPETVKKAARR